MNETYCQGDGDGSQTWETTRRTTREEKCGAIRIRESTVPKKASSTVIYKYETEGVA